MATTLQQRCQELVVTVVELVQLTLMWTTERHQAHNNHRKEKMDLKAVVKVRREVKKGKQLCVEDQLVLTKRELMKTIAAIECEQKN